MKKYLIKFLLVTIVLIINSCIEEEEDFYDERNPLPIQIEYKLNNVPQVNDSITLGNADDLYKVNETDPPKGDED